MKVSLATFCLFVGATAPAAETRPPALESIEVTERLGERIPLNLVFTEAAGRQSRLGQYFGGDQPVILILAYYECPMLCNLLISGTVKALNGSGLKLGRDYRAVTVSIDPTESSGLAASRKAGHLQALGAPTDDPAWGFLVGEEEPIRALAQSVGFGYARDAQTNQYAHAAVAFILSPEGKLSRYLYGVEFSPRDLKLALIEAADGKVGTSLDRILLRCFKYDPALRKYGIYVWGILKGGALLVFVMLATLLAVLWRRELKQGTVR